jgi:hypothetical protein
VGSTTGKASEGAEEAVSPASVCEVEGEKEIVKPCLDDADSISWTTWLINGEEGPHSPNPPGSYFRRRHTHTKRSTPTVSSANSGSEKNLLDLAAMVPTDGQTTALPLVQGEESEPAEGATDRPDEDSSYQYKISQKMLTRKDDIMFSSGNIYTNFCIVCRVRVAKVGVSCGRHVSRQHFLVSRA